MLGGNLFGRHALHPSVTEISDPAERGKVVNAAWRRYGTINGLSLLAVATGHFVGRLDETSARRLSRGERGLIRAQDALVGAVAVAGVATAAEGVRFSRMEPGGAVPLRDGAHADPRATPAEGRAKTRLDRLGAIALVAEIGLVSVNAAISQRNFRRPALRRLVMLRD